MSKSTAICIVSGLALGFGSVELLKAFTDWHPLVILFVGTSGTVAMWFAIYICILLPLFIRWGWMND